MIWKGCNPKVRDYAETKYDLMMTLPLDIYPLDCICVAAYDFIDDFYFYMFGEKTGNKTRSINVAIKARNGDMRDKESLIGRFQNELIRQALRAATAKMNRDVRKHIIGRALASAAPERIQSDAVK